MGLRCTLLLAHEWGDLPRLSGLVAPLPGPSRCAWSFLFARGVSALGLGFFFARGWGFCALLAFSERTVFCVFSAEAVSSRTVLYRLFLCSFLLSMGDVRIFFVLFPFVLPLSPFLSPVSPGFPCPQSWYSKGILGFFGTHGEFGLQ